METARTAVPNLWLCDESIALQLYANRGVPVEEFIQLRVHGTSLLTAATDGILGKMVCGASALCTRVQHVRL